MDSFSDPRALAQLLMLQQMQQIPVPPLMMSDAVPYPVLPGQEYAMMKKPPIEGLPRGEAGGGSFTKQEREVERALEQIRKENAGLTREQRRERMRIESEKEFNRGASMSDAEWEGLIRKSGLGRK